MHGHGAARVQIVDTEIGRVSLILSLAFAFVNFEWDHCVCLIRDWLLFRWFSNLVTCLRCCSNCVACRSAISPTKHSKPFSCPLCWPAATTIRPIGPSFRRRWATKYINEFPLTVLQVNSCRLPYSLRTLMSFPWLLYFLLVFSLLYSSKLLFFLFLFLLTQMVEDYVNSDEGRAVHLVRTVLHASPNTRSPSVDNS